MTHELRILIAEDSPAEADRVEEELRRSRLAFVARRARARSEFEAALPEFRPDLILCGAKVGDFDALEALRLARRFAPDVPFILISSSIDMRAATVYLEKGVTEYVNTESLQQLGYAVRASIEAGKGAGEAGEGYRRMVELSPDGLFILRDGRITYANEAALRLLGATGLEQVQGKRLLDLAHPECRELVEDRFRQLTLGLRALPAAEEKWLRLDGAAIDVEVAATSFTYEGQPAAEVQVRDISARKRAQRALYSRTRQQAGISDLSQRALVGADVQSLMRKAVEAAARTLEMERAEVLELLPDRSGFHVRETFGKRAELPASLPSGRESPAGLAAQSGIPVTVENLALDERFPRPSELIGRGFVAGICVPVPARGRVFGVLAAYSENPRSFTVDDVHFLQSAANVLGAAIERRRIELRLTVQNAVTRILSEAASLEEAGRRIIQEVCATLGWEAGALWRLRPEDQKLHCVEVWHTPLLHLPGFVRASREAVFEPGGAWLSQAWSQTSPIWSEDFGKQGFHRSAVAAAEGLRAAMAAPLMTGSQVHGALEFFTTEVRPADFDLLQILELIGTQLGLYLERRRAEEALRESEERYRRLVELSPDAIFVLRQGRVAYVNSAGVRLLRAGDAAELLGKPFLDYAHPGTRDRIAGQLQNLGQDGRELPATDHRYLRADGGFVDVEVAALGITFQGKPGILLAARDVTSRQQLEDQLRQSQRMEAVGRLAGGVAHDFNNLLTAISGYGQLIQAGLPEGHPQRPYVDEVLKAGDKAAALTRQLLAFSRKQVLELKVIDVNAVVSDMETMLRRVIGEDVELLTAVGRSVGRVKADPGQLQQVLMNLVVNARDAMPRGGKITIGTAALELDESFARHQHDFRPGPYVMLTVSDTGVGMDPQTVSHLFEPFFTTKGPGKGTGLGLSTVYGIVKQSGGYITVYSEPGRGTTFRVYLPRAVGDAEAGERRAAPPAQARGHETVLLVEDSDVVRKLTREILHGQGYTVLEARNGTEAIRLCRERRGPLHLMLTDVVMPEMGGPELAGKLAAILPGVKVLYMSGYAEDAIAHHGVLDPGAAFLSKPFTPSGLAAKVREVLDAPQKAGKGAS